MLLTAAAKADDACRIRLSGILHVGDVMRITIKADYQGSTKWMDVQNVPHSRDVSFKAEMTATGTVNAVNTNGSTRKVTLKVTTFTKDGKDLVPSGTKIVAENIEGRTEIQVDGEPAADDLKLVLNKMVATTSPDRPTLDEEMGSAVPRKVGESWPANNLDQMAKATRLPFEVAAKDLTGSAKLKAISTVDGKLSETIELSSSCEFDSRAGENGTTYKNLKRKMDQAITLPLDGPAKVSAHV